MKKILVIFTILMLSACAHQPLKTSKKAPCDFEKREVSAGYEDNTK